MGTTETIGHIEREVESGPRRSRWPRSICRETKYLHLPHAPALLVTRFFPVSARLVRYL